MLAELSTDITEQALQGISIPPCPTSLTSILRESKHPSTNLTRLSSLISRDAGITGPLLKLANSPFVGLRSKVDSVLQAVNVLGMQNTLNLVHNIALRQSIGGGAQHFEKFWERSSMSASVAERVAAKLPGVHKDTAYIAALFHDCGIPVLMMKHPEYQSALIEQGKQGKSICEIENEVFSTSHTVVGNMLTRSWMLPAHVCKAILYHHDHTIFSSVKEVIDAEVCNLISIVHMAECIVDEFLEVKSEWPRFEQAVLKHLDLSAQEFFELKQDNLALLGGE